jgi:predicted metal-binding membrane protein
MASASNILGGIVLIAAAFSNGHRSRTSVSPQCQTPFQFLMRHGGFRGHLPGCLLLGLRHGVYCFD